MPPLYMTNDVIIGITTRVFLISFTSEIKIECVGLTYFVIVVVF